MVRVGGSLQSIGQAVRYKRKEGVWGLFFIWQWKLSHAQPLQKYPTRGWGNFPLGFIFLCVIALPRSLNSLEILGYLCPYPKASQHFEPGAGQRGSHLPFLNRKELQGAGTCLPQLWGNHRITMPSGHKAPPDSATTSKYLFITMW